MKIKNKGKVYPSPSSSSSSSSSSSDGRHVHSVLKLLPAAILALAYVLSIEDREVLAYMINRSIDSSSVTTKKKPSSRNKPFPHKTNSHTTHKHNNPPLFDCDCFDCYTSYWFRWDSSPCREQIHQAIDAFEEYQANGEKPNKKNNARGKKKDAIAIARPLANAMPNDEQNLKIITGDNEAPPSISPENADVDAQPETEKAEVDAAAAAAAAAAEKESLTLPTSAVSNDKGFARKMLPDVLGILNSRLWNLWSPNV